MPRSSISGKVTPLSCETIRIGWLACALLVISRLAMGWHLFYEGMWKIRTQSTSTPWSAEGYLKNAIGPMRSTFRNLTGDPRDMNWLDFDTMSNTWERDRERFIRHYGISEETKGRNGKPLLEQYDRLLIGQKEFSVELAELPKGLNLNEGIAKGAILYDAGKKRLIIDGKLHLLPAEKEKLIARVKPDSQESAASEQKPAGEKGDGSEPVDASQAAAGEESTPAVDPVVVNFLNALDAVFEASTKLSAKERLEVLLKGDPDRVGILEKGKSNETRMGDIERYGRLIDQYEAGLAKAKTAFEFDHLDRQWKEVLELRAKLVGPVVALDRELKQAVERLLPEDLIARGPVPPEWTQIRSINFRTMWGLTIIGLLLIIGLFTRTAALGGCALLMLFYLAAPPWPGVPEIPGPEHNFIVNKILVEFFALLAIAALPTGKWFGLDSVVSNWCRSCCPFRRKIAPSAAGGVART